MLNKLIAVVLLGLIYACAALGTGDYPALPKPPATLDDVAESCKRLPEHEAAQCALAVDIAQRVCRAGQTVECGLMPLGPERELCERVDSLVDQYCSEVM